MCLHNFFLFCFYFHFVLFSRKIRRAAKRVPKRDRISTVSQYDIDKLNKKRFVFVNINRIWSNYCETMRLVSGVYPNMQCLLVCICVTDILFFFWNINCLIICSVGNTYQRTRENQISEQNWREVQKKVEIGFHSAETLHNPRTLIN